MDRQGERVADVNEPTVMPPRMRLHRHVTKSGLVSTNYYWDGRSRGAKDIPLGGDFAKALERYTLCEGGIDPGPLRVPPKPPQPPIAKPFFKKLDLLQVGKRRKLPDRMWGDLPMWARRAFLNAERRARAERRVFTLTIADMSVAVGTAGGRCTLSKIPFEDKGPFSPSIDRIDSSHGYMPGNIRIVCLIANVALNNWGEGPLRTFSAAFNSCCGHDFRDADSFCEP